MYMYMYMYIAAHFSLKKRVVSGVVVLCCVVCCLVCYSCTCTSSCTSVCVCCVWCVCVCAQHVEWRGLSTLGEHSCFYCLYCTTPDVCTIIIWHERKSYNFPGIQLATCREDTCIYNVCAVVQCTCKVKIHIFSAQLTLISAFLYQNTTTHLLWYFISKPFN